MSEKLKACEMVSLAECPIGLFEAADGTLCLKTEYGNNDGRIDAFIAESGEFFWGSYPQTVESQRRQMVCPIPLAAWNRRSPSVTREQIADAAERILAEDAEGCFHHLGSKSPDDCINRGCPCRSLTLEIAGAILALLRGDHA